MDLLFSDVSPAPMTSKKSWRWPTGLKLAAPVAVFALLVAIESATARPLEPYYEDGFGGFGGPATCVGGGTDWGG